MEKIKATLIVDLGNSETRVLVQSGKGRQGLVRQRLSLASNHFAKIDEDYIIPHTYSDENTTVLITEDGELYANGLLVEKEFSTVALRPTAIQKKHESKVTKLSLQLAFYLAYKTLSEFNRVSIGRLDVEWKVVYLLPPNDIEEGSKALYDIVMGMKRIEFAMPEFAADLNITEAVVYPEGFTAYIGTVMGRGRKINENYAHLLNSKTLIFDIGAGTTDFFVVEGTNTIDRTKSTIRVGGNNVVSSVRQGLIKRLNVTLPESIVEQGTRTGFVKDGSIEVPIDKFVKVAREYVANSLVSEMISYFENINYPLATIENLLVVGGGSLPSTIEGVHSLSYYLVNRMKDFAPNIKLVDLPTQMDEVTEDTTYINPRELNILGAGVLSEEV